MGSEEDESISVACGPRQRSRATNWAARTEREERGRERAMKETRNVSTGSASRYHFYQLPHTQ